MWILLGPPGTAHSRPLCGGWRWLQRAEVRTRELTAEYHDVTPTSRPARQRAGVSTRKKGGIMSVHAAAFHPFKTLLAASLVALAGCAAMNPAPGKRELMIVGLDEKQSWDESGKAVIGP